MRILAIETSCDETAAAVVEDGTKILTNVVASSTEMHRKYGGIVPEVAAREQLRCVIPVIQEALLPFVKDNSPHDYQRAIINFVDTIAVTVGPGLIGSLLVGVETAKTLAFLTGKPLIPVNHVLAHMYANFVSSSEQNSPLNPISFPAISLVVSGGHTELFLMTSPKDLKWLGGTLDDAAGEAFDKTARLLGFENRGGVAIQEAANKCHPGLVYPELCRRDPGSALIPKTDSGSKAGMTITQVKLPRPLLHDDSLNFSFSGLKTAIMREWNKFKDQNEDLVNSFAYEVQEAITDVLVTKTLKAVKLHSAKSILIAGGVASNLRLREKFNLQLTTNTVQLFSPPVPLCTDNAVYIASYAFFRGKQTDWHDVTALPDMNVEV